MVALLPVDRYVDGADIRGRLSDPGYHSQLYFVQINRFWHGDLQGRWCDGWGVPHTNPCTGAGDWYSSQHGGWGGFLGTVPPMMGMNDNHDTDSFYGFTVLPKCHSEAHLVEIKWFDGTVSDGKNFNSLNVQPCGSA